MHNGAGLELVLLGQPNRFEHVRKEQPVDDEAAYVRHLDGRLS